MRQFARLHSVRFLAAVATLALAVSTAAAESFSQLVVFGDSLSDVGNISYATFGSTPGQYYYNGRFSNGPVYAETLASGLSLPLVRSTAGGNNFAYGGAKTSGTGGFEGFFIRDINEQVDQYLANRTVDPNALYLVLAGANDLLDGQTNMSIPVNTLGTQINRLITAGARKFLSINLPLLGYTPRFNGSSTTLTTYNTRSQQFNSTLATKLDSIVASNPAITMYRFDLAALFGQAVAQPAVFGLVNVTMPAAPGLSPGASSYDTSQIAPDANQYMFWDDLHPTTTVHAVLGRHMLELFTITADYNQNNAVEAADYILLRKGLGSTYTQDSYNMWRSEFGGSKSAGAATLAATVPEPCILLLAIIFLAGAFAIIRRG